jgi:hypothetical protein
VLPEKFENALLLSGRLSTESRKALDFSCPRELESKNMIGPGDEKCKNGCRSARAARWASLLFFVYFFSSRS